MDYIHFVDDPFRVANNNNQWLEDATDVRPMTMEEMKRYPQRENQDDKKR